MKPCETEIARKKNRSCLSIFQHSTALHWIQGKFCKNIGVANIRQYEEKELKTQQDKEKKKLEYENQINRIINQLEYERKREDQLLANVQKFERTVQDDEDGLETAKKIEQVQMSEIDEEMKNVDKLKMQGENYKASE